MQTIRRLSKQKRELLVRCADTYETADFLKGDPSWFMHQVEGKGNQEVMAFIAPVSAMAHGRCSFPVSSSCSTAPVANPMRGLRRDFSGSIFPMIPPVSTVCTTII